MNDRSSQRYYFDANALVKYYREESGSLQIKRLVSNNKPILISPLTLVECVNVFMKLKRNKQLKKKKLTTILKLIDKNVMYTDNHTIRLFKLIAIPEEIFLLAKRILVQHAHTFAIGSNDALHLAILQTLNIQAIMVTSDVSMQHVCEDLQIQFYDPEKN
jgi:predicted nucleic acid-binding protein